MTPGSPQPGGDPGFIEHLHTKRELPDYTVGSLSIRLNRVFRIGVYALIMMVASAVWAVNQRLTEAHKLQLVQQYSSSLLKLDSNLYRLQRDVIDVFYAGAREGINRILADSESIWLDYDSMLAQREAEEYIRPPLRLEEHQLTVMKLRTGLVEALLLLRADDVASGLRVFERGPRLHIEQLHNHVKLVLEATDEYRHDQEDNAARARIILLTLLVCVVAAALLLFRLSFLRLGETTTRLEVDLEDALKRVARQERLSTIGQLAGTISHELRNPLGTIRTSVYNLGMTPENKTPEARKIIDRIERSILRCDAIVSSLLDYMRQPELHRTPVNLKEWTLALLDEQELPAGITLVRPEQNPGTIVFDPELMRRAFLNVYSNACQAIEEKNRRQQHPEPGKLEISLLSRQGQVGIEFLDSGAGISDSDLPRVFEPLFSTRSFGIGLGMLIVQQILEQHGGSVEIESELDVGTRVTLWLPADSGQGALE